MTRRYYFPDLPTEGGLLALSDSEAQHAARVMRVQVGDAATLFDGEGNEAQATFLQVAKNRCLCNVKPAVPVDREPRHEIHLGIALPKPDRARELIERLTEIGVKSVTPIAATRTQRSPSDSLIHKLRRGVVEACKQSGRNQLLVLRPIQSSIDFFESCEGERRWIAHPDVQSEASETVIAKGDLAGPVTVAIGPEGGWTEEEFQRAADSGFRAVDLGRRIYRIETAATVIASLLAT